jgi:Tol biopolymer transport system component
VFLFSLETGDTKNVSKTRGGYVKGFSADGKELIVFQTGSWQDEPTSTNQNLAIDLTTGATRPIRFPESSDAIGHFDISPDQRRIVYLTSATNRDGQRLVVADIHFQDKKTLLQTDKKITHPMLALTHPVWSPDGTKIAYNDGTQLKLIAPDGSWHKPVNVGKKTRIDVPFWAPPAWSPDGARLAITCQEDLGGEIGIMENYMPKAKLATK